MESCDTLEILGHFDIPEAVLCESYGNGHINDTYLATTREGVRFILQRVNQHVFHDPVRLMENIARVTDHLWEKTQGLGRNPERRCLTLVQANDGNRWYQDPEGSVWRTYLFIEDSIGYDLVRSKRQAVEAGRAFGEFFWMLADLPGDPLHATIPHFHDLDLRLESFRMAVTEDVSGRAAGLAREIDWVEERAHKMTRFGRLQREGALPSRTTHNDTKFNNVLLDLKTDEALCVIDLDTVMPGLVLNDFGDSVRTVTNTAVEDEADLDKIGIDLDMFRGYTEGYLTESKAYLTSDEMQCLAFSGLVMTYTIGLRFFTDHLSGDSYFKVHFINHNLQRSRAQFALVESMEASFGQMQSIVKEILDG